MPSAKAVAIFALLLAVLACRTGSGAATKASPVLPPDAAGAPPWAPDTLAYLGYFAHPPYAVEPYAQTAKTWADLAAALEPLPTTAEAWNTRRPILAAITQSIMGDLPARPAAPVATIQSTEHLDGYQQIHFQLENGVGQTIPGWLLLPDGAEQRPAPLIHYMHYDGGEFGMGKREILSKTWPLSGAEGAHLAQRGYAVMAIDAYAFGERQKQVPGQPNLKGAGERDWWERHFRSQGPKGASLWGMMLRDDQIALDWIVKDPRIDTKHITAMGMSMGSKRAFWMGAIDDRITSVIAVAGMPIFQEGVTALVAPRPFLTLQGDQDVYTPKSDFVQINAALDNIFAMTQASSAHRHVLYPGVDHDFTLAMWSESLSWLATWSPARPSGHAAPDCWGLQDGLYCGSNQVAGDPATLYQCSGAKPGVGSHKNGDLAIVKVCTNGCQVRSADQNDGCE